MKIGDYILVTSALFEERLGKVAEIMAIDDQVISTKHFWFRVYDENGLVFWVNGIPATELIKALA
jgi:hypothetical protein